MESLPNRENRKAKFAALVRTTGERPAFLREALQSLMLQGAECLPVVIVHGGEAAYAGVERTCGESAAAGRAVLLRAERSQEKRRGHPVNVGIEYCLSQRPEVEFLFLLDDDDIVYPYFTSRMASAFIASEADVVYAASNRREPGQPPSPGYVPKPIYEILRANFITSNSYAMRASKLRESGVRMAEDLEYMEDWHFLIRMVEAGFRFHSLDAVLSEFRTVSDGNREQKREPEIWQAISSDISGYVSSHSFPIPGADLVHLCSGGAPALQTQLAETNQRLLDSGIRLNETTGQAGHYKNLLDEMEQKFLDSQNRLKVAHTETQHYRNLLEEKIAEAEHAGNLLKERTTEAKHASNLLDERTAEAQHARNLLEIRTSEAKHAENLLEESRRHEEALRLEAESLRARAGELAASIQGLGQDLESERAAHHHTAQELAVLKAKVSKIPVRWLVR